MLEQVELLISTTAPMPENRTARSLELAERYGTNPSVVTWNGVCAIVTTLHDRLTGFAQLIKVYRTPQDGEKRYSPAEVQSVEVVPVYGQPDPERICTSIVERSNLSLRMGVRRFTRLTNAFSKKWENHASMIMLWFAYYNFCRIHKSLRVTPAMGAGVADHVWDLAELLS